ncbi:J domain-containing protein [Natronosalvus vescus]|uniref:J domain-containing protein n=1 Tax=Natronosalvus vescus TaxID=2953881 RepID=UPI002090C31A|nr:J domain-containing protein [Natronosalvus vescus]
MPTSVLEAIPPAVLAGLILGGAFSLVATAIFVVGNRVFPDSYGPGRGTTANGDGNGNGKSNTNRYSSEGRRRGEIRSYLQSIGERYREEYQLPDTDVTVAFYLPDRDVAVTFVAEEFFTLQRTTDTYVILVEHEMPGVHLGGRLPFEVPEPEPTTDSVRMDPQRRLRLAYKTLGLPSDADHEAVRSAYRERIKQVHPDHGGDTASFRRVQEAYATVSEHAD